MEAHALTRCFNGFASMDSITPSAAAARWWTPGSSRWSWP